MINENKTVECSGADENSQHPTIYIKIKDEKAACPYCGRVFHLNSLANSNKDDVQGLA